MTHRPAICHARIGTERQPLVTIDTFSADPEPLRAAAIATPFHPADHHYPGIRGPLPDGYMPGALPVIARALGRAFRTIRRIAVIDASFSIVTTPAAALSVQQRLPHVDGYGEDRVALIHYLSPDDTSGTAFFRHRATGFESIGTERAETYQSRLQAELDSPSFRGSGYINGDTDLFDCIDRIDARYNRALLYRSTSLHSGAIAADAILSADPARGRLTVTAFLSIA
ncbi:hypothetical protein GCM10011380_33040 [Sphingomonas metalli]|uniref:Uncharacterized protein n=1 Tax=Sphingomonas metalli TaxID=1779358 RepID=A0A916WYQ9_9SPHN|nr:DUF6445 family protein [Sphingomonas metalli]GGB40959.1 hypothetical protein GCM10011380_33040 [Sphingomonas metalli]